MVIGITQTKFESTFSEYRKWVESNFSSFPLRIVKLQTRNHLSVEYPQLNGIIFTGGADIHKSFYGIDSNEPISERDLCESKYFEFYRDKIPVLGICRGMQLINCIMGGTLYSDLVTDLNEKYSIHLTQDKFSSYHKIIVEKSTFVDDGVYFVNSRHHQAVRDIAPGLILKGKAEDGTIEILEDSNKLLVQFHPEKDEISGFKISSSILQRFGEMIVENIIDRYNFL